MITSFTAKLTNKTALTPTVSLYQFTYTDTHVPYMAGQYYIVHIPQEGRHSLRRLYSIASDPRNTSTFEFLIKHVEEGVGTTYLNSLPIGTELSFQGPAGLFTLHHSDNPIMFLATGTGIAPMRSMLYQLAQAKSTQKIVAIWGNPTYEESYFHDELEKWRSSLPGFSYYICLSREQQLPHNDSFLHGRITEGYECYITNPSLQPTDFDYYICGSKDVVESMKSLLTQHTVDPTRVHFEKFW